MEKFLRFQTEAEITINESIALLQGYLSFIETTHDISEEESNVFLDNLLTSKKTIIRNIGIEVYPEDGNSLEKLIVCADKRMYVDKDLMKKIMK